MPHSLSELSSQFGLHSFVLVVILAGLEAVLSADNAIALAALVQGIEDEKLQNRALNLGMVAAFTMRMLLIFTATWVVQYWQFELLGAMYLLWLALQYFLSEIDDESHHHGPRFETLWQAIPLIAVTDLAFSLDSVTTAIALANERWLVITGGVIGIIMLRSLAGLFIRWLKEYVHLQDAGYITVALVGLRLLIKVINDHLVPPQWAMVSAIAVIFAWGFSQRVQVETRAEGLEAIAPDILPDAMLPETELAPLHRDIQSKETQDMPVPK
jgi:YkoY family integral membrane protein